MSACEAFVGAPATPFVQQKRAKNKTTSKDYYHEQNTRRVVGLDVHPDTFAGAILRGRDPATAQIEHTSTHVLKRHGRGPLRALE